MNTIDPKLFLAMSKRAVQRKTEFSSTHQTRRSSITRTSTRARYGAQWPRPPYHNICDGASKADSPGADEESNACRRLARKPHTPCASTRSLRAR